MNVIALLNMKPGTAKTTSSVFLAAALHEMGERVLLVDSDPALQSLGWGDKAGGFPFRAVGFPVATIRHQIVTVTEDSGITAVVIDTPQMEDHADIVEGAVRYVWDQGGKVILTVAAKPIELQRAALVKRKLDHIGTGERWALLNRTNRARRSKTGPDAETAEALSADYRVLTEQVPYVDGLYSQTFGEWPLPLDLTPYPAMAKELIG
jgi:chromosome partitioning protein